MTYLSSGKQGNSAGEVFEGRIRDLVPMGRDQHDDMTVDQHDPEGQNGKGNNL